MEQLQATFFFPDVFRSLEPSILWCDSAACVVCLWRFHTQGLTFPTSTS
jgi:hypothetical protein